jgi:hypothetical protein
MNAAIAVAAYAFLNFLTAVSLYFAATGRFPSMLTGLGSPAYGLLILLLGAFAWFISGSTGSDSPAPSAGSNDVRTRVWKRYYLGTIIAFLVACAAALVRMG